MPLQPVTVPIPIGGLDQKADRLGRRPGQLDQAINVRFDKAAEGGVRLDKRKGYQRLNPENVVGRFDEDSVMTHVAQAGHELIVFSYDYVAAIGSRESAMRGRAAMVYRGPCNRGACRMSFVSQSPISQSVTDDVDP